MALDTSRMTLAEKAAAFPMKEAREIAKRFSKPKPHIYWLDFSFHIVLAWAAFYMAVTAAPFSWLQVAGVTVAVFTFYRALIFIHELAHLKRGTFKWFRLFWNFSCGFAMMVPSYFYTGVHIDHHKPKVYGLKIDGEYLPLGAGPTWKIPAYVLEGIYLPLLLVIRHLILTPLSYVIWPMRKLLWERASSLTIDMSYVRSKPSKQDDPDWRYQEFFTFVYVATIVGLIAGGVLPITVFYVWYTIVVLTLILNALRTLGAHAYRNPGDKPMGRVEEFLDSVDIPGTSLDALWAPVGLRFHATHHLFPSMPYHELGKCYRELVNELPNPELYLSSTRRNLPHALRRLWADAKASQTQNQQQGIAAE
ncbi:putative fatty acid desaturase [Kordiimonas sediminis]|uniref:Fatty acid desaturase n=1 Tax=Kordiimonas sediminis TaxID=1735581 RepID=A0A919ATA1_9PROT|nr:fatty acid desaturase [Kordiimonas sediminis]GHF24231.1 putative fatty acid desaturase [Kordiimonas sediminis]